MTDADRIARLEQALRNIRVLAENSLFGSWRHKVAKIVDQGLKVGAPPLPPVKLDMQRRCFTHCQATEDECTYQYCPRWRDGKIVNEAHCALDLIPMHQP